MRRLAVFATLALVSSCRISLEDGGEGLPTGDAGGTVSPSCMEATTHDDLAFLEAKVFGTACTFSGCHNGANDDAGKMDLRSGMSFTSLVNKPSVVDPDYMLVVPGMPQKSYLLMMVQHFAPEEMDPPAAPPPLDVGLMPQNAGGRPICSQKREAIARWITAGAMM